MKKELKADISLFLVTIAWGGSFPVTSIALKSIPPYSFLMLRFLIAGVVLAAVFHKRLKNINKATVIGGIIVGLTMFLGTAFQAVGLQYTTSSKSGFITGMYVVMVPILVAMIYKKLPDKNTIMGAVLALAGLAVISLNGTMALNYGDLLTVISALFFAFQILAVDKYACNVDPIMITMIEAFVTGGLGFIPAGAIEHFNMSLNVVSIGAVIYTSIFCTVIAYGVQNKMQPYTNPSHAAIIYLAEPVFCAIFSVLVGDKITIKILIGCVIIFIGMIITNINDILTIKNMSTKSELGDKVS